MGAQQRAIVASCIVIYLLTFVQSYDQTPSEVREGVAHKASRIRGNIQNLFDSVAKEDTNKGEVYRNILKHELIKERRVFHTMEKDLRSARSRNTNRNRNSLTGTNAYQDIFVAKRETNANNDSSPGAENKNADSPRKTGEAYMDEDGFYRLPPEEENLEYDRKHTYRAHLLKARERLVLCKAMLEDIIIDWEILYDEGIIVKDFDTLVNKTQERLAIEIDHMENEVWLRDPRMAAIIQPTNQSCIDELSSHFKALIRCVEEQKPEEYPRIRFDEMISRLTAADEELVETFDQVFSSIAEMKRKYNV